MICAKISAMSLDKAIEHGKEKRKPYYQRAQQVDLSCRCHGGCPWCEGNRKHSTKVRIEACEAQEEEDINNV